jgi:hypothetical protein
MSGRAATTTEGEFPMTDYQFKTILKMVRDIAYRSDDVEEIRQSLDELISETKESKPERTDDEK